MNKILCVIIMTFFLIGCTLYKHVFGYEPQKFDYEPDKAYAEIVQRLNVPKGFYAEELIKQINYKLGLMSIYQ